jgi:ribose-phosphate pyrophosphokinase
MNEMFGNRDNLRLMSGNASQSLSVRIAASLGLPLTKTTAEKFSDGEIHLQLGENIRGVDAFIVQSTPAPADNLLELLMMIDACKRASADRVTAVIPYFGYARQDRKDRPRVPITAKLVANLIAGAGADRVLTMDLHAPQIQGFFDLPLDHLLAAPVLLDHVRKLDLEPLAVVAPDVGSVKMARAFAKRLGADLAIVDKRRPAPNVSECLDLIGSVEEKHVIIFDDMIDTAGTLVEASKLCKDQGALTVHATATHAVFSGPAKDRIDESPLSSVAVTDSLGIEESRFPRNCTVLDIAPLLAEAIRRIHNAESVSSLFI